jgi:hypothetical protein
MLNLVLKFMEAEQLIKARAYFEKAKGKRMGLYMSELRSQFVLRMHKEGAKSRHIGKITFLRHDQIYYYIRRYKENKAVSKIISENMDKWIEDMLYPVSVHTNDTTEYVLNEDPLYKSKKSRNIVIKQHNGWDDILDFLDI